ncbi:hypothetical protein [Streptosporangium sp. NPDC087985]|uniref:hypothetical protein n=1 Tax=Streptosporangium sp. NPDC087985 TaxID=3366196 RepID=UPI00382ED642
MVASVVGGGAAEAASPQWRVVQGAPLGPYGTGLADVAATGPQDVWAVGYGCAREKHTSCPAIARWNGDQWKNVTMPAYRVPAKTYDTFDPDLYNFEAVHAASPNDVWVVGNGLNVQVGHWNGRSWSMYRPFGVSENNHLSDVEVGRGRVWFAGTSAYDRGTVLSWSGRAGFTQEYVVNGSLAAVSAGSRTGEIWAVGSENTHGPLVVRGTGQGGDVRWEELSTPSIPGGTLTGVWPISADDVWAIGYIGTRYSFELSKPLALHFNGKSWSRVPLPVAKGRLTGITADSSRNMWVSGVDLSHPKQALFLQYSQGKWISTYGPKFQLGSVSAVSISRIPGSNGMWAVGRGGEVEDERDKAFILRYG